MRDNLDPGAVLMDTPGRRYAVYDCFTGSRFGGNPGGIVFDTEGMDTEGMLAVAREINAPVTGFITGMSEAEKSVSVRFFMPKAEIAMCGHVTVGLFSHLASQLETGRSLFTLKAQAGEVEIEVVKPETGLATVMMSLTPSKRLQRDLDPAEIARCLKVPGEALKASSPPSVRESGLRHLFVSFRDPISVSKLTPDFEGLSALSRDLDIHTVACFAMLPRQGESEQLVVRDFCPAVGVNETPASGTTNAALSGYLAEHGLLGTGITRIVASQGAAVGRPSKLLVDVCLEGDRIEKVSVGGNAILSLSGSVAGT